MPNSLAKDRLVELDLGGLVCVAPVLVLLLELLVLDEGFARSVLLLRAGRDFFVFGWHGAFFQLFKFLLVLHSCNGLIFAFGVHFPLQNFGMRQLVGIVSERVVPLGPCLESRLCLGLSLGFLLS